MSPRVERILPAFAGLTTPEGDDMAAALDKAFGDDVESSVTVTLEWFEAIYNRIHQIESTTLESWA